jgi:hypothetical protein
MARIAAIVLVVLALLFIDGRLLSGSDEAVGLGVRGSDEAIEPIRQLTVAERVSLGPDMVELGDAYLGFYYRTHGIGKLDIYRSDGKFVVFSRGGASSKFSTTVATYMVPTDATLDALGDPSTPWRYRITPGLLFILAFSELGFVVTRNVTRRFALIVAVTTFVLGAALLLKGLHVEAIIPLAVATIHGLGYFFARVNVPDTDENDNETPVKRGPAAVVGPPRPSPQAPAAQGPFRAAPAPQLAIERPATAEPAKSTPIAYDEDAPPPSILR